MNGNSQMQARLLAAGARRYLFGASEQIGGQTGGGLSQHSDGPLLAANLVFGTAATVASAAAMVARSSVLTIILIFFLQC